MRTGTAFLPLHYGRAPAWLFQKMKRLAREITIAIVTEFGPNAVLQKLSDPFWFQALGCVLGFDWHSSGLTTTVCGALKEGIRGLEHDLGLVITGGKGGTSRKTPEEIEKACYSLGCDASPLVYASKMAAKVDNAALQDGYQLYHHAFIFTRTGDWAVVQQGMNEFNRYARRYHWLGERVKNFVVEPHSAICSEAYGSALNMIARESEGARRISSDLSREKPGSIIKELKKIKEQKSLWLPQEHQLLITELHPERLERIFLKTYEIQPESFRDLLAIPGVGAKTIRALSLISEIVYAMPASFRDPARFSFAHGGKDGIPYPVDREGYEMSIRLLRQAINQAKLGNREKLDALRRLGTF